MPIRGRGQEQPRRRRQPPDRKAERAADPARLAKIREVKLGDRVEINGEEFVVLDRFEDDAEMSAILEELVLEPVNGSTALTDGRHNIRKRRNRGGNLDVDSVDIRIERPAGRQNEGRGNG